MVNEIKASIRIDASELIEQIKGLVELFKLKSSSLESVPEQSIDLLFSHVSALLNNIVTSNFTTTVGTGDVSEVTVKVKIIGPLDELATAIRAGDLHSFTLQHD